ncbi:MAG: YdgA family protein [Candidatus Competibacteraceae bacterium]|jgi:uncharacterized protein YdgA (DUF945 family)|nr:YdgA family protein [Candidatus Competibacteraceae bacterium]
MKRVFVTMLIVLVLLVGGLAGASYWAGVQAERLYKDYLEQGSQDPKITLTQDAYQRNLFSSEALTQLTLTGNQLDGNQATQQVSLPLRQEIYHGPVPIGWWWQGHFTLQPMQAVVRTVLGPELAGRATLDMLFDGREPLTVVSYVALDGSILNRITIPYLDVTERLNLSALSFSGLRGDLQVAPLGRSVKGKLNAQALYAMLSKESGSTLRFINLHLTMDQRFGEFGFMVGDSVLGLETLETTNLFGDVPGTLKLSDLVLHTNIKERESWIDSGISLAVKELTWNQATVGSVQFQLSANHLDGATLAQLRQWNRQYSGNDDDPAAINALLKVLPALLRDNPELVWEMRANALEGDLQANAKIVLQDPGPIEPRNPVQWLNALANANAELSISRALLEASFTNIVKAQLIAAAIREGEEPDDQELTDIAILQTQRQLAQLHATRWLLLEGESYRTQARFEQGRLFVNDTEIPYLF